MAKKSRMLKRTACIALAAGLLPFALTRTVPAEAQVGSPTFNVFVAAPIRDGFQDVSKDTSDTIKDISGAVKRDKRLTLVTRREDADVVIVVIGRGVGSAAFGARTDVYRNYYGGTSVQSLPMVANTRWITTVLIAGTYQREFAAAQTNTSAFSLGDWSFNASTIVKNIGAWVTTNAETLQARRGKSPADSGPNSQPSSAAPVGDESTAPKAPAPLTVDQIIQMAAAKLPDDLIITTIRNSGSKFELTPEVLIKLKGAGVSDAVIRSMSK